MDTKEKLLTDFLAFLKATSHRVLDCSLGQPMTAMPDEHLIDRFLDHQEEVANDLSKPQWVTDFMEGDKAVLDRADCEYDDEWDRSCCRVYRAGSPDCVTYDDIDNDRKLWSRLVGHEKPAGRPQTYSGDGAYVVRRYPDGVITWEDMGGGCSYYWPASPAGQVQESAATVEPAGDIQATTEHVWDEDGTIRDICERSGRPCSYPACLGGTCEMDDGDMPF